MRKSKHDMILKIADLDRQDAGGNTLLHWAAEAGDIELVKGLIANNARLGLSNFAGDTPFAKAAAAGQVAVMKTFEEAGYDWRLDRNYQGETPLYLASKNGHLNTVMYMISKGAFIDVPSRKDMPLHVAIKNKHFDVATYLVCEGALLEYKDCCGKTPVDLLIAEILDTKSYHPKKVLAAFRCLNAFIEKGASIPHRYGQDGVLKDILEGVEEKCDYTFRPLGCRHFKVIQKGTNQLPVPLDLVRECLTRE